MVSIPVGRIVFEKAASGMQVYGARKSLFVMVDGALDNYKIMEDLLQKRGQKVDKMQDMIARWEAKAKS